MVIFYFILFLIEIHENKMLSSRDENEFHSLMSPSNAGNNSNSSQNPNQENKIRCCGSM